MHWKIEIIKSFSRWKFRGLCLYAGPKSANEFDHAGIDNLNETPHLGINSETGDDIWGGVPGWYVLNFSTEYTLVNDVKIQIGIDIIMDAHYKTFGSGISAPGRNFNFSAKYLF